MWRILISALATFGSARGLTGHGLLWGPTGARGEQTPLFELGKMKSFIIRSSFRLPWESLDIISEANTVLFEIL